MHNPVEAIKINRLSGFAAWQVHISTLMPISGSNELWIKPGHDNFIQCKFDSSGHFAGGLTKLKDKNDPKSRMKTYGIRDVYSYMEQWCRENDGGAFYIPGQPIGGFPTKDGVNETYDLGFEFDSGTEDEQLEKIQVFCSVSGLSPAALLTSGGKSIQGHIHLDRPRPVEDATYLKRLLVIGLMSDPVTVRPHQPMRIAGLHRKEKGRDQELLFYSHEKYSYEAILEGFAKWFAYLGLPMSDRFTDDWWVECFYTVLKGSAKLTDGDRFERIKAALTVGLDAWEDPRRKEQERREMRRRQRLLQSEVEGEQISDVVEQACIKLGESAFTLAEHKWKTQGAHTRGLCSFHDSKSGNSAWIAPAKNGDGSWCYHCTPCTDDKPIDAFRYWLYTKNGFGCPYPIGKQFVDEAKAFLDWAGVELPDHLKGSSQSKLRTAAKARPTGARVVESMPAEGEPEHESNSFLEEYSSQITEHPDPAGFILAQPQQLKMLDRKEAIDRTKVLLELAVELLDKANRDVLVADLAKCLRVGKREVKAWADDAFWQSAPGRKIIVDKEVQQQEQRKKIESAPFPVKLTRNGEVVTPKPSVICNTLLALYKDSLIFSIETKRFYRYEAEEKGVWSPEAQEILRAEISEELDKAEIEYSSQYINSVVSLIGDKVALKHWIEPTHLIPVENGVLDRYTLELLPHSPKYKWRWKLPYPFNAVADCQPILNWMHEACEGQQDRVEVLLAYLKAILTRRTDLQRFMECIGEGGTGKGTYLRLATALAGVQNTMPTSLKQLEGNRFETAAIFGKILVTITDSEKYSGDVSTLKALTGQDLLRFEAKNRQVGEDRSPGFYSDAMVLIASNEPMQSIDRTSGLQRRRLTIPFNNQVASSSRRDLITLTNQGASGEFAPYLPGLLYHVLCMSDDRVTELIRDTESHCESLKEASQENILKTNPLAEWLNANCVFAPNAKTYVGKAEKVRRTKGSNEGGAISSTSWDCYQNHDKWLYANYRQFCDQNGIQKPISMKSFGKDLVSLCVAQLKETSIVADKDRSGAFIVGIAFRGSEHDAVPTPVTQTVMVEAVDAMDAVMDAAGLVMAETQAENGCDGCDGFPEKSFNRKIEHKNHHSVNTRSESISASVAERKNSVNGHKGMVLQVDEPIATSEEEWQRLLEEDARVRGFDLDEYLKQAEVSDEDA